MFQLLNTKKLISLSFLLILISSITLSADINQQIHNCSQIDSNKERLACFDNISMNLVSDKNINTHESSDSTKVTNTELVHKADILKQPNPIDKKTINKLQEQKIKSFGLPVERTSDEQQIKARLIGDIKRWDENSIFKLDNGQIWRAVRSNAKRRRSPVILSNPVVTITRAILGSYDLRIEGMQGKLKVKRIK